MKHTNVKMVTVAMLVAILLVAIDVTVVSTAMPRIVGELSGLRLISWVFAIYTLTTAVTTPIYGKLSDLFGRKIIFSIGVALFLVGSMLSGASQSMTQLILFRALQGLGAGAVMPVTFTIIGDLFPGEKRARMQGLFSAVWGVAGLLGPLVGGFFVDEVSWRWIFYINLPVGAISLVLVWLFLHEHFEKKQKSVDYGGAITFTIAMAALLYALLNGGQQYAWASPTIIGLFVGAAVFLALFILIEAKVREPMLPLSLFGNRVIAVSNFATFMLSAALIAVTVYMPMWMQDIIGYSATSSGLTLMPMSLAWPLGSTLAGRFMYRVGSKATAVFGAILVALGSVWLVALTIHAPLWMFIGIMVCVGLGMGLSNTPFTVLIQSAVGWNQRGAATASSTFMRALGQTVGIAIFGTVFNRAIATATAKHVHGAAAANFSKYLSPGATNDVSSGFAEVVHQVLYSGLHLVFIGVIGTAIVGLVITLLMPAHRAVMQTQVHD